MDDTIRTKIRQEVEGVRESVIQSLSDLTIKKLLKKANPFLLACFHPTAESIVSHCLDAHICSSMECKCGSVLENIAIAICGEQFKSGTTGVDLDIIRNKHRLLVSVKSGPSWGNSQSTNDQWASFRKAKKTIRQNGKKLPIVSVMGICYSRGKTTDGIKHADIQVAGQNFWYLISGDKEFYQKLAEEMMYGADEFTRRLNKKKSETYQKLLDEYRLLCADGMLTYLIEKSCKNYSPEDSWINDVMEQ